MYGKHHTRAGQAAEKSHCLGFVTAVHPLCRPTTDETDAGRDPSTLNHPRFKSCFFLGRRFFAAAAVLLLALAATMVRAQTAAQPSPPQLTPAQPEAAGTQNSKQVDDSNQARPSHTSDRSRAAKLYLASSKLFEKEEFEEAMQGYERAARLDPSRREYVLAAAVARSHAVTALIQTAAKDRIRGDAAAARSALSRALELDPNNIQVTEHLHELGDDQLVGRVPPLYEQAASTVGSAPIITPEAGLHSFHVQTDQRQLIQQVFKAYGVNATVDDSVQATQIMLDLDDANFQQAVRSATLLTGSFYVPLDAHRVLVARNTVENHQRFTRLDLETIYLGGLTQTELTDVGNMAKTLFEVPQSVVDQSAGAITVRAPASTLNALNTTLRDLLDGRSQVLLEVRMIQLAHTHERNTGVHIQQQVGVFNIYAETRSILDANQALVQQIISSGLAAPGDTLAILGILLASGQVSSSLLNGGIVTFGGGNISTFGASPGPITLNLNLNSSESRELDQIQLRLGDGEVGTLRTGMRYPIQTSSFSSLAGSGVNIPGLNSAGNSSALSSLLSQYGGGIPNVPQVEYQDLGLTLKATPKVMRNSEVALTIDMKIDALAGGAINGNPILNNRAYSGVVTLKQDEGVVVVSELDRQESRAISGTPGISEIPGLNNITGKDNTTNYATLLIVITPHVIRGTQAAGHSPMMRVERTSPAR